MFGGQPVTLNEGLFIFRPIRAARAVARMAESSAEGTSAGYLVILREQGSELFRQTDILPA
jgi:hypothetical protein